MKKVLVFVFLLILNTAVFAQTISRYASDPANNSLGFARAHWATSINKMVVFFGGGNGPFGDNSVRAFDPVTNRWEYLWPNNYKNGGIHARDNYASLYIPRLDELWIWGGSYLELIEQKTGVRAYWAGRFKVTQKKWVAVSTDGAAFSSVVANFSGYLLDNATAWSAAADMGMIFGGSEQGNLSNRYWIIEPNANGSQPYKMSEVTAGTRPPPRAQCMNCLVAVGGDFYLFGGYAGKDANGNWVTLADLWKFSSKTRTWTELPRAPGSGYQSTLTYDSNRNALVAWVSNKIYVFDLTTQQWSDQTPAGLPCIFNQVGIYAPTINASLFEGGNRCSDGGSPGLTVYGISLTGQSTPTATRTTTPIPTSVTSQTGLVAVPPSTLKALDLGVTGEDKVGPTNQTTSNGKPDFHISVSGLRGTPNKVTITNDNNGTWETPFNKISWIIASQYDGKGNGDFWFEQYASNKFHVKVSYADGTTDETDALKQVSRPPPSPSTSTTTPAITPTPILGPTAPPSSPPSSPLTVAAPTTGLNILLRTWVARRFNTPNAPASGVKGGGGVGSKHLRLAQNPLNGRIYFNGGDYSVKPDVGHSWYGLWSYDVMTDKWFQDYPWCGKSGEIMPSGRDEVGWVWDSKRNIFWMLPGFMQQPMWRCPAGGATEQFGILTFNPATNKWSNPNAAPEPISGQKPKNGIYDPLTDSIYRSGLGVTGVGWTVYHIATNSWDYYATPCATGGEPSGPCASNSGLDKTYINNSELGFEYLAADLARRKIYAVDPVYYRLFEFDMDKHTVTIKAPIPEPNPARVAQSRNLQWTLKNFTMPVFDSVNDVLLYPYINALDDARPKLLIYHSDTNTWETDPMYQPNGFEVRGNSFVFDPIHNVLISFSGLAPGGDADPTVTHFFLYRYGNGTGQRSRQPK